MKLEHAQSSYPIDEKIIIIGNEPNKGENPNKLIIGRVTGYQEMNGGNTFIVYKEDDSEEEYITLSKPMYYSKELENALLKLTWDERWNIFSGGISIITEETKKRKEGY